MLNWPHLKLLYNFINEFHRSFKFKFFGGIEAYCSKIKMKGEYKQKQYRNFVLHLGL